MAKKDKKDEEIYYGNPFQDNSNRYPMDQKLRVWGFQIERRPKYGPNIWSYKSHTKKGIEIIYYTEQEAIDIVLDWEQQYGS